MLCRMNTCISTSKCSVFSVMGGLFLNLLNLGWIHNNATPRNNYHVLITLVGELKELS